VRLSEVKIQLEGIVKNIEMMVAALAEVKCGVSVHPSHTRICALLGEEERILLQQVTVIYIIILHAYWTVKMPPKV
jgi:hypothetical protein